MAAIKDLLGESVRGKGPDPVPVESFSGPGTVVAFYFSAHWCGPCRGFTPRLVEFYNKIKQQKDKPFEIVFLSSDRDEKSFEDYYKDMPWLAVPMGDKRKKNLSQKYKVAGIPTLVLLDGETGEIINKNGRSLVVDDPDANEYPWPKPDFNSIISGNNFINNKNEEIDATAALQGKVKGLYFSAHWCPPCRQFTPVLVESYKKIKEAGKAFEIVFLSSDKNEESFKEYFDTMPWLSCAFKSAMSEKLKKSFEVDGIPMLILLDENNKIITENARGCVSDDPEGKDFPWYPKALNKITEDTMGDLESNMCVLLISDDTSKEEEMKEAMMETAEKYFQKGDGAPKFLYGFSDDDEGVVDQLFMFLGIKNPKYPVLLAFKIGEDGINWKNVQEGVQLSKDLVKETLVKYEAGTL